MAGTLRYEQAVELKIPMPWGQMSAKAWGNPGKYPVLGLHGYMDNAGTFDRLVPLLTNTIYFVAVDLPGHGLSSPLPSGVAYHFGDYLIIIRRVQRHFSWDKFSIIGHSMGAALTPFYASMYHESVEKVVLLDMAKPKSYEEGVTSVTMRKDVEDFLQIDDKSKPATTQTMTKEEAIKALISATDESLTRTSAECLLQRGMVRVGEDKWAFRRDLRVRIPSMYRFDHQLSYNFMREIRCHLLFIKAKESVLFDPPDVIEKTMALYKNNCASFQRVDMEGNHYVHLNDPKPVAELINKLLLL